MTRSRCRFAVGLFLGGLCMSGAHAGAATLFVDANLVGGADNGTTWGNAYNGVLGLQKALTAAASGDQIWVADGTYKPDLANRSVFFVLKSGVEIYGGFAGTETLLTQRDPSANVATLTGDLLDNDGGGAFADNSFHVVSGGTANNTALIDGFVIRSGNANGSSANDTDRGGGLIFLNGAAGRVRNCIIQNNRVSFGGGGIYVRSAGPSFEDCIIRNNFGANFGGGIDFFVPAAPAQTVRFDRCQFITNQAARAGGVEAFGLGTVLLSNCLFYDNVSTGSGGGGAVFVGSSANAQIRNCSIVGNRASVNFAGVHNSGGTATVANSIVYFNTGPAASQALAQQINVATATYSCVQNILGGTGNISANPALANTASGDLRPTAASPGIDAANNALAGAPIPTIDLDGNPRFVDDPNTADTGAGTAPIIDMGAYEFTPPPPPSCPGDANGDLMIDAADLSVLLSNFGQPAAGPGFGDFNGDGLCNGADLSVLLGTFGTSC